MFITIEGIEGSGKSTLIKGLEDKFINHGKEVCKTREPGGSALGKTLRPLLVSLPENENEKLSSRAELLLFLADRAEHLDKIILPALENKQVVLCDRYVHSTLAYQGYARGFDLAILKSFIDFSCHNKMPDLTILLDLEVEQGLARAKNRNSSENSNEGKFEAEEKIFHQKVRNGFLDLAKENSKIVIIDATLAPNEIIETAWKTINTNLNK